MTNLSKEIGVLNKLSAVSDARKLEFKAQKKLDKIVHKTFVSKLSSLPYASRQHCRVYPKVIEITYDVGRDKLPKLVDSGILKQKDGTKMGFSSNSPYPKEVATKVYSVPSKTKEAIKKEITSLYKKTPIKDTSSGVFFKVDTKREPSATFKMISKGGPSWLRIFVKVYGILDYKALEK